MKQKFLTLLLALVSVTAAWAAKPDKCLDACTGGEGLIHVQGWAYDPDASAQSIDVHVYIYTDADCTNQYGGIHVLTANQSRPDVNAAKGITGDHGFNADIHIADAGDYWVKVFAIDAGGDGNPQIGATTAVTVTDAQTAVTSVQTLLNGDLNHNGVIDIADVTAIVNVAIGRSQAEVLNVITSVSHEYVDLGLPSGTLWATCNIGAENPEDYGDYFAWGETEGYNSGKTTFDWSTYMYCNGSQTTLTKYCNKSSYGYNGFTDTLTELESTDDAAYANWGADWRMPSKEQFDELINSSYTTTTWTTQNGVYGRKITSKSNGNSIFLPETGYRDGSSLNRGGSSSYYWSRTLYTSGASHAYALYFDSINIYTNISYNRYNGRSVRPVRKQ